MLSVTEILTILPYYAKQAILVSDINHYVTANYIQHKQFNVGKSSTYVVNI